MQEASLVEAKYIVARGKVSNTNGTPGNVTPHQQDPRGDGFFGGFE